MSTHKHTPPQIGTNVYTPDNLLKDYLKRHSKNFATGAQNFDFNKLDKEMEEMGEICATKVTPLGIIAERHPPKHIPFDAWHNRIDEIETHPAWSRLLEYAASTGIVGDGYHRRHDYGRFARLVQFSKLYLFDSQSAVSTCPMAMTDGGAKLLETHGLASLFREEYEGLISKNPDTAITAGQHMTETRGGSDVSYATETIAKQVNGNEYHLYGYKWFTSAIDAQIAFSLARIVDKDIDHTKLTHEEKQKIPVSLFLIRIRDENGKLNGITVYKMKDKLGTKALPTAELKMEGTKATLISPVGRGIAYISPMLTITRTWNAVCAVSKMRRIIHLVQDYSTKRVAFGKKLAQLPAHIQTLARINVEYEGCFHLVMDCAKRIGFTEVQDQSEEEVKLNADLLRILTPLAKMYTGKIVVPLISEGIECIGGQGYMEDTGIPSILRDAQVLPIWEGTTNVQALDVLRVLLKNSSSVFTLFKRIEKIARNGKYIHEKNESIDTVQNKKMETDIRNALLESCTQLTNFLTGPNMKDRDYAEAGVREFAFSLSRTYILSLMLEHAFENTQYERDLYSAYSFLRNHTPLVTVENNDLKRRQFDQILAMGSFLGSKL